MVKSRTRSAFTSFHSVTATAGRGTGRPSRIKRSSQQLSNGNHQTNKSNKSSKAPSRSASRGTTPRVSRFAEGHADKHCAEALEPLQPKATCQIEHNEGTVKINHEKLQEEVKQAILQTRNDDLNILTSRQFQQVIQNLGYFEVLNQV